MSEFKVGDRVAVYGLLAGDVRVNGKKATVVSNHPTFGPEYPFMTITFKIGEESYTKHVHPKQCRRLVKRERRRVWVSPRTAGGNDTWKDGAHGNVMATTRDYSCNGWLEFIEVRKK